MSDTEKPTPPNPLLLNLVERGQQACYPTDVELRDLFAAFALVGLLAPGLARSAEHHAAEAFRQADAMLAERSK